MKMEMLVATNATKAQVQSFVYSFSMTNYFHDCIVEVIPQNADVYMIRLIPDLGNASLVAFMGKELVNPESGYVSGGLIFAIAEVDEKKFKQYYKDC